MSTRTKTPPHHMLCGCVLTKKDLVLSQATLSCPEHLVGLDYIERVCHRCGSSLKSRAWRNNKIYCEECNGLLAQASVVYSFHGITENLVDPMLWRKGLDEILQDIKINALLQYEAIQIDLPMEVQHEQDRVTIDIEKKLRSLNGNQVKFRHKGDRKNNPHEASESAPA